MHDLDPFGTGKLPSGRHGLPREVVVQSQRERMIEAMIAATAEKGYAETTVADVIAGAGVSRATFYEQFGDKEDCFVAAYGTVMERMLAKVTEGYEREGSGDWVVRVRGAIAALLDFLAHNPPAARVGIVEGFGAGSRARDRYREAVSSFFPFLDSGRELTEAGSEIPENAAMVVTGGLSTLMFNEASAGHAQGLPRLLPEMTYMAVVTYLGHERAIRAKAETVVSAA